ncbi:regulatory protein RecX [Formosa agariphila KMM 3901]|uniref:Regulatory protein RecX n=1 Tax=Formosa agariphila (strain DSM 15362 / KCTC 12365 / LMG 23005 / KMM 3901 / M-2Alg 35-1) TaxID=1347342 RepID=T2KQN8_FORAG|nr:regulatory protein RecX [Formosa agariphila]CDF81055.1 regulatory protein RecX [Formosa agariphila KMM 3901]
MDTHKTYTVEEAKRALEHYCAYQERCHKEVQEKLRSIRMIPEAIDEVIVHLLNHNFLNEERFAKAYVRGKFKFKNWGRNRLTMELKRRQISRFNIQTGLKELDALDYYGVFDALAERKYNTIQESNKYKKKKKLADYLLYRGWESPMVYEKVNELIK